VRSGGQPPARAHRLDHAGSLMAEDCGTSRLRGPVGGIQVAVANAAGVQADQDFAGAGRGKLELGHLERVFRARKDSGERPQRDGSPGTVAGAGAGRCIRRSSSIG